jgi:hypothetical protein
MFMASSGWNPHKKGEHVFNDISGSVENALESVLSAERVRAVALVQRFGHLRVPDLTQTSMSLDRLKQDSILSQARTVVAPATGLHNDANSRSYSKARVSLETALSEAIVAMGVLIWKKKPMSNSSFLQFDSIVIGMKNVSTLKADANAALDALVDSAYDLQAEASALSERVSDAEIAKRRRLIDLMKSHRPVLKQIGYALLKQFSDDVEIVLEYRINAS